MASKFEIEIELKSTGEKFWKNLREYVTFYPKALPQLYESIEILEGDGKSAGSVNLATIKQGESNVTISKEKIVSVDEETKTLNFTFLEGEIFKSCKSFREVIQVVSKDEGSLIKYSAIYDKANEEAPDPELMLRDFTIKFFQDLDAYLINT